VAYYLSVYPYFQSYLLVVQGKSVTDAGRIVQMWTFAATITGFCVAFLIKYVNHYKFFVTLGGCIYFLGIISMIFYRVEGASTAALVATTALVGIGGGMLAGPAQLGVQASVNHGEVAAATAIFLGRPMCRRNWLCTFLQRPETKLSKFTPTSASLRQDGPWAVLRVMPSTGRTKRP
jgi:hypothetical protein